MKKKLNYQNVEVGEELGQKEVLITDEMIQACANAIESKHPWYFEDSPYGGRIAPPTIFDNDTLRMLDEKYDRFGSIHTRQIWDFKNPAKLGMRITLNARIIDKYIKRGRGYVTMELAAIDEEGLEICRGWHTSLISLEKGTGE